MAQGLCPAKYLLRKQMPTCSSGGLHAHTQTHTEDRVLSAGRGVLMAEWGQQGPPSRGAWHWEVPGTQLPLRDPNPKAWSSATSALPRQPSSIQAGLCSSPAACPTPNISSLHGLEGEQVPRTSRLGPGPTSHCALGPVTSPPGSQLLLAQWRQLPIPRGGYPLNKSHDEIPIQGHGVNDFPLPLSPSHPSGRSCLHGSLSRSQGGSLICPTPRHLGL